MFSKFGNQEFKNPLAASDTEKSTRLIRMEPLELKRLMSVSLTRSRDHTYEADETFTWYDSTGTILTSVQIDATTVQQTSNGKSTYKNSSADMTLSVANEAGGYFSVASEAPATSLSLTMSPDLSTAHLVASFNLTDLSGVAYTATCDTTWHASDAVQKNVTRTLSVDAPGMVTVSQTHGDYVDAVATGTVTTTATPTSRAISNATPFPSIAGALQDVNTGTLSITYSLPPKISSLLQSVINAAAKLKANDLLQQLTGM